MNSQCFNAVLSRDVTDFRENGKSTLIGVEYKPLLPAFMTLAYCYRRFQTNTITHIMAAAESQYIFESTLQHVLPKFSLTDDISDEYMSDVCPGKSQTIKSLPFFHRL